MTSSPLSNFTIADFSRAQLVAQIGAFYEQRGMQRSERIAAEFGQKTNSLTRESDRWRAVRTDIQEAKDIIGGTLARIKSIRSNLNNMISNVNKAEQNSGDSTGPMIYASAFDALLNGIDSIAKNTSLSPNLIGVAKQALTYKVGIYGTTATINSANISSDYYVIDTDGKYWNLNRTAKTLKRYDVYPDEPTSTVGHFVGGLKLDSLAGDTVSFTVAPDTATPESFTGTLYRNGLSILDSWAYDGMATSDGRTRALEDLNAAKDAVDLEIRRYEIALTTSNFYDKVAKRAVDGLTEQTNDLLIEQAAAIEKAQDELAREYSSATGHVTRAIAMQNEYALLLKPLIQNKFAAKLISILA